MGTKYPGVSSSGYNSGAPVDDGSQVAANLITWAGVKTKLADPIKTLADAENTALVAALDLSARAISGNDTAIASDHWKTLQVTGATTITLSSAASMGAGYEVGIFNAGASTVTVTPGLASDTINNLSASVTIPIKGTMIFRTNQGLTGYNVVAQSNRMDAGAITGGTIDNAAIGGVTPAAGAFTTLGATGLISATGGQIGFPAAQNASAGANVLDDYEEGVWTPDVGGSATFTTQAGLYTKIGRLVFIQGLIVINSIGSGSTTVISGLPFTAGTRNAVVSVDFTGSVTNVTTIVGRIGLGTTSLTLESLTAAGASLAANAIFQNGTSVLVCGCYHV
jgi:hypothetical protein